MVSVWVWCWTTLTQKLSISLTASPLCSRLPRPCCTYLLLSWSRLDQRCGATTWRPGMAYSTTVGHIGWKFNSEISKYSFCFYCGAISCFISVLSLHQRTAVSRTSTRSYIRMQALQRNTQESWQACSCWTSCPLKTSKPVSLNWWRVE